ncbi:MAG: hypothetical protein PHW10_00635 [Candidatus Peribacteraceae bacterium]|nr:hypothetical protein [Candidatus Peribacteraceae bacterium]
MAVDTCSDRPSCPVPDSFRAIAREVAQLQTIVLTTQELHTLMQFIESNDNCQFILNRTSPGSPLCSLIRESRALAGEECQPLSTHGREIVRAVQQHLLKEVRRFSAVTRGEGPEESIAASVRPPSAPPPSRLSSALEGVQRVLHALF